jgi:hypothetical protein
VPGEVGSGLGRFDRGSRVGGGLILTGPFLFPELLGSRGDRRAALERIRLLLQLLVDPGTDLVASPFHERYLPLGAARKLGQLVFRRSLSMASRGTEISWVSAKRSRLSTRCAPYASARRIR